MNLIIVVVLMIVIKTNCIFAVFWLHRMHEMLTILIDVRGACLSKCHAALMRGDACCVDRVPCARRHYVQLSATAAKRITQCGRVGP